MILLSGAQETALLRPVLSLQSGLDIVPVHDLTALRSLLGEAGGQHRLVAFCTSVIVPAELLRRLPSASYNIHPGSPAYPGRHPESWAAYHGATRFGATLHEMAPRVDEGAIVDVEWIDAAPGAGQLALGIGAFQAALRLMERWAEALCAGDPVLPRSGHRWSGRKTTHADYLAMCRIAGDAPVEEIERRRRAFGELRGSPLIIDP